MALDPVKNFAISRVATAPSPADSGTTLVVETGDGALFPDPSSSGEYNVVIYPNGEQPTSTNAEIVRVTARTSDTMTIDREEEGTSARTIVEGDIVMLAITAKMVSDLSTAVTGVVTEDAEQTLTNKTLTAPALTSPTISGAWDGWISAGETWTYASADDPTYTFTVAADVTTKYSAGMKIKLTQGTVKYFIITAVSTFSGGNTTITVYGGTDYDLANAAITANYYSMVKSPFGFPMNPAKWSVVVTPNNFSQAGATSAAWYEATNISLPIGSWDFGCSAMGYISRTSGTAGTYNIIELLISETTANNAPYQLMYSYSADRIPVPSNLEIYVMQRSAYFRSIIITTAKKSFYLNLSCTFAGTNTIGVTNMRLSAVCAYL